MEKLKRVVIKEELVALTGDYRPALILNQLIYWSERVSDFDKFIEEENQRMLNEGMNNLCEPQNGWIYKTAAELSEELMVGMSHPTIRKYLKQLIENGWIDERRNPKYKWDKTMQYRVNITKIQKDLLNIGYALEGYRMPIEVENNECKNLSIEDKTPETSNEKNLHSCESNLHAISEITSEITSINKKSLSKIEERENKQQDENITLIEEQTIKLTDAQKKKVSKWDIERTRKAIELFIKHGGQKFAYLQECYNNPLSNTSVQKDSTKKFTTIHSHDWDLDELEMLADDYMIKTLHQKTGTSTP